MRRVLRMGEALKVGDASSMEIGQVFATESLRGSSADWERALRPIAVRSNKLYP
jgi:hypothetical protein